MTDHFDDNLHPSHSDLPTREDVLIGRVVDGEASDTDWADLDRVARADPDIWKRVAHAQRAHARLERAVEDAIAVAELVDIPVYRPARAFWGSMRSSLGWAVAAVLAIAFVGRFQNHLPGGPAQNSGVMQAGLIPLNTASPDQAYDRYIRSGLADGRVVGEMEPVLIEARQVPNGTGTPTHEVIVMRRVVERFSGENLPVYTIRMNEHGIPTPSPYELPTPAPSPTGTAL